MLKRSVMLAAACVLTLATRVSAVPVMINFDALPAYTNIDGMNLGGVTLTAPDGSTATISDGGVGYRSPFNAVTTYGFVQANFLTLTFDVPTPWVTVTGGDRGGDTDQFTIRGYDALNNLLGTFTTPVFGGNPIDPLLMADFYTATVAFGPMARVEIQSVINAGIGIDDLGFDGRGSVPEPATLTLVGLGLLGMRRRRHT